MAKLSILAELLGAENVARGLAAITEGLEKMHDAANKAGEGGEPLEKMSSGITDIAIGFAKGAAGALAMGLSIDKLVDSVKFGIRQWAEMERLQFRLAAVFEATGNAAGVTAEQIINLSTELSRTTFATQSAVLQGAASLATFRSVHGETFEQVLRLSQDVAEVMGRDFNTVVIQMGRAMESVSSGSAEGLRRSFNFLSPSILESVKRMTELGQRAEAMDLLLKEVQKTVGGVGAASHEGLSGSMDNLSKSVDDLWQAIGRFLSEGTRLPERLQQISGYFQELTDAITNPNQVKLNAYNAELERLTKRQAEIVSTSVEQVMETMDAAGTPMTREEAEQFRIDQVNAIGELMAKTRALRDEVQKSVDTATAKAQADEAEAARILQLVENNRRYNEIIEERRKADKALGDTIREDILTPQELYNQKIAAASALMQSGELLASDFIKVQKIYAEQLKASEDALASKNNEEEKALELTNEQFDRLGDLMPMVGGMMEKWEDYKKGLQSYIDEGLKAARTPMEEFVDGLNKINEAVAAGINITPQQRDKLIQGLVDDFNAAAEKAEELSEAEAYLLATTQSAMDGFAEAITSNLTTAGDAWDAFKNIVLDVGKQILDMILKLSVINPLLNSVFGTSYTTIGDLFGSGTGVYAGSSAAFYGGGPATPGGLAGMFATGGDKVITRPSLIAVGENGPEHISVTPLSGGRRGGGGGGGGPSIYIDARNSNGDQAVEAAVREGLRRAMPGFVEAAAQSVRMRYRMDPGYLR